MKEEKRNIKRGSHKKRRKEEVGMETEKKRENIREE